MRDRLWVVVVACAVIGACDTNMSGNTTATVLGDTNHRAQRGSPVEPLRENCGDGKSHLRRQPYLQQVTATSAMIGWVTTSPDGERVVITQTDGIEVSTVGAEPQASKQRRKDETQMWATVTGLSPSTTYCYAITNGTEVIAKTGFRTAPAPDDDTPIRFLAFGDSGGGG